MNIQDISHKITAPSLLKTIPKAKSAAIEPNHVAGTAEVKVNMSRLTRMMADNASDLSEIHEVRQDKIDAHKHNLSEVATITDEQIDSMLKKMIVA